MADAPLATVDQLSAYLQLPQPLASTDASALLYLQIASGMVRDYLQQKITAVAAEVALVNPAPGYGFSVFLPEMPVTNVSLVETLDNTVTPAVWKAADPTTYTVNLATGVVAALPWTGVIWPTNPGSWRITYDHGFATVPDGLMGVTVSVAAREYTTPAGVDLERVGGYQVKYDIGGGFTDLEQKTLNRYIIPRVA